MVTPEDSPESEAQADQADQADQAGAGVDDAGVDSAAFVEALTPEGPERGPSRLGRGWATGICAAVVLLAAGAVAGGYFAWRFHHESQAVARDNAAAITAAKDCLAATQAADSAALPDAQRKIVECSTGNFGAQATLYSGMLAQAYRAAGVRVQVAELRAAVERDNADGSVDLLMPLRVKVDNVEAQGQDIGYRLRVKMAREEGQYKIASIDQVAK